MDKYVEDSAQAWVVIESGTLARLSFWLAFDHAAVLACPLEDLEARGCLFQIRSAFVQPTLCKLCSTSTEVQPPHNPGALL